MGAVIKLDRGYPLVSLSDGRTIRCEHATSLVKRKTDRAVIGDRVEVHLPAGHGKGNHRGDLSAYDEVRA